MKVKELLRKLVGKVDILVENFRPGTMDKLGLGYETLKPSIPSSFTPQSADMDEPAPMPQDRHMIIPVRLLVACGR